MFYPFQKNFLPYYVGLVFVSFPLLGLKYFGYPMWTLPLTLLFVVAYIGLVHLKPSYRFLEEVFWHYLLFYIVLVTCLVNGNMMWFLFFPSNLLVWRFEKGWRSYRGYSLLTAILIVIGVFINYSPTMTDKVAIGLVIFFILGMTTFQMQTREEEELKDLLYRQSQENQVLVAENERNRIGRDLHDTLGHTFAMMSLKTELALKQLDKENIEAVRKELEEINQISRTSMQEVRTLINHLKYRSLEEELLALQELLTMSHIEVSLDNQLEGEVLLPRVSSSLVMILRELVTNIIKHAESSQCQICLKRENGIVVMVSDNGKGFSNLTGTELHSIRERLTLVSGEMEIVSPKAPTLIHIRLEEGVNA
ncbi:MULTISPECIES: sensor histidine kinase [Streptococcus]|uniref:histidine kinase n=1 Tax=Streptococcus caledonicus TaxID=2614158 RepID=A0ABW0UAC6_9STRE|nr:sensor histidine kinase [Streptococcus sp. S784/96/1]